MAIRAVIFDFDGVIADTEGEHLRCFQRVVAPLGVSLDERMYAERYLGYSDRDLIQALRKDFDRSWTDADMTALLDAKRRGFADAIATGALLYPAARACIERLGAICPLAIASGAFRDEIQQIVAGAGLAASFVTIVGAEDVARSKPAPDAYLEAARRLGLPPRNTLAIEDSPWGLEAAHEAGCRTLGITHSYARQALSADLVIDSLEEITEDLIGRIEASV